MRIRRNIIAIGTCNNVVRIMVRSTLKTMIVTDIPIKFCEVAVGFIVLNPTIAAQGVCYSLSHQRAAVLVFFRCDEHEEFIFNQRTTNKATILLNLTCACARFEMKLTIKVTITSGLWVVNIFCLERSEFGVTLYETPVSQLFVPATRRDIHNATD